MKYLTTAIILFVFYSCSSGTKKPEDKVQSVRFHYIAWACDCANWATGSDIYKYQDPEEPVDKAKVFRYTAFKVIKSNYREAITNARD